MLLNALSSNHFYFISYKGVSNGTPFFISFSVWSNAQTVSCGCKEIIMVGQKAPSVTLFDSDKNKVSLDEQKGKNVILMFFPLAFTGVCTTQLCTVRDDIANYNNTDAAVFGISVDSLFTLGKFKEQQNINFPLLSDFNKEASKAFGVLYETFPAFEMKGVSKRAAFVIDKEGIIKYAEVCPTPGDLPDFNKIKEVLAQLN